MLTTENDVTDPVLVDLSDSWRELLTRAGGLTWTANRDGVVLTVGADDDDVSPWVRESMVGQRFSHLVHPLDLANVEDLWRRAVSGEVTSSIECRARRGDGAWVWLRQTMTHQPAGTLGECVLGMAVDVTAERLEAERSGVLDVEHAARYLHSGVAQVTLDQAGMLTSVNDAFCALAGRGEADLVGTDVRHLLGAETDQPLDALLLAVAGVEEGAQLELTLTGAGDHSVRVLVNAAVLRHRNGAAFGAAAFIRDLTTVRNSERRTQLQSTFFSTLSRLAGDVALVGDTDGRVVYVSPAVSRVLGYAADELVGGSLWALIHPEDADAARTVYAAVVKSGVSQRCTCRVRAAAGDWRWVEQTASNFLHEPLGGIVSTLRDVTAQVAADQELKALEARFHTIVDTADEGIWAATESGKTLYANQRLAEILGRPLEELYAQSGMEFLSPEEAVRMTQRLAMREQTGTERYEVAYQHPDGGQRQLQIAANRLPGDIGDAGSLAMISDITETRRVELELRRAALQDALTGLPNRTLLLDRLEHALARDEGETAVLLVNLDGFRLLNDSLGHAAGDQLLVAVSEALVALNPAGSTVGRMGADEFVIIVEDTDARRAQALAESVLTTLSSSVTIDSHRTFVSAAIGIAVSPASGPRELLRCADRAMAAAKAEGPGRVRLFDRSLSHHAEATYELGTDLRAALLRDDLRMHFQPIIDLRTGLVLGAEALARWTHPLHGEISPAQFVTIADGIGLSPDLDRWAIRAALRGARLLRRAGALAPDAYVAVNLAASNLADPDMESYLVSETAAAGLTSAHVTVEITESGVMRDADKAISLLRRLRALGYRVAVDDFGTGYSSLAYLRDLPITSLKVDQSFVSHIRADSDALAIVASIIDLARAVGVSVVAEGIETEEQAELLRGLGCGAGQGWLWARAMSAEQAIAGHGWPTVFEVGSHVLPDRATRHGRRAPVLPEHGLARMLVLHQKGASLATIAAALNVDGYLTPKGLRWHSSSVARAIADSVFPGLQDSLDGVPAA